jgi:hypothetical protein
MTNVWSGSHTGTKQKDMTDLGIVPQGIQTDCLILECEFLIQQNYFRAGKQSWAFDQSNLNPD